MCSGKWEGSRKEDASAELVRAFWHSKTKSIWERSIIHWLAEQLTSIVHALETLMVNITIG